jgi:two-component sensor histidine kinase
VPGLRELVGRHTDLTPDDLDHLHLLLADWQLLADLSFADLVLWLPTWNGSGYVAGAQMRPTTGPTVFTDDLVGGFLPKGRRPLLDTAMSQGRIVGAGAEHALVPAQAIPVVRDGRTIAVIARHADPATARRTSRLEDAYLETFEQLATMVAEGSFPYAGGVDAVGAPALPRVGDGLLRLDRDGVVLYASPNALSAYRRLGLATDLIGTQLSTTTSGLVPTRGTVDEALSVVASGRAAKVSEVEAKGTSVVLRSLPLQRAGRRLGALVLVRDVTELRRRERELLSKDATIREIHHRVKNNLQTVAALLRLQARRLDEPEGRSALEEAVRRVGSIAVVHEILSVNPEESVAFDDVCDRVCAMVTELSPPDARVAPKRVGSFGVVAAEFATPLAMALSELLHNAVEHGLRGGPGQLEIRVERAEERLQVEVVDDGVGLPDGFVLERSERLGLQIVRTLVVSELGGALRIEPRTDGPGTRAALDVPLHR